MLLSSGHTCRMLLQQPAQHVTLASETAQQPAVRMHQSPATCTCLGAVTAQYGKEAAACLKGS